MSNGGHVDGDGPCPACDEHLRRVANERGARDRAVARVVAHIRANERRARIRRRVLIAVVCFTLGALTGVFL